MKTVRGHFDGTGVSDNSAPIENVVEVTAEFPKSETPLPHKFHWQQRLETDTFEGSVADEVIRQRRIEDTPE